MKITRMQSHDEEKSVIRLIVRGFNAIILMSMLLLGLGSCGGGGGGGGIPFIPQPQPPFIYAELDSFPPGSEPPGFQSAFVYVIDDSNGNPITTAMVKMNGVLLTYNAAYQDYEGNVAVNPGDPVSLSVTVGVSTYTVSGTQFTIFPTITSPAANATWSSWDTNTVIWSVGTPTTNAFYDLGVLDSNGNLVWPADGFLKAEPISTTSDTIPPNSLTPGSYFVIVDIAIEISIANAAAGSVFVIAGFDSVSITASILDATFGSAGKVITDIGGNTDEAFAAAIQGDGKIVAAGTSWNGTNYDFALARYNTDGNLDTTLGGTGKVTTDIGGIDDYARAVAIQGDGKIVAAGYSYNRTNYNTTFALVRYNTDGSLDTAFGANGKVTTAIGDMGGSGHSEDYAYGMVIQGDGKIVVAGYATLWKGNSYGYGSAFALVRYNTDGSLDTTFGGTGKVTTEISIYDAARAVAIQGDGKIVAVGYSQNGFTVVRYNTNGSLDTTFGINGIVTTTIGTGSALANAVAIQSDGKIVAVGYSNNFGIYGTNHDFTIIRYNADGSLDGMIITAIANCNTIGSCNDDANAVAIQGDGKIVAAGYSYNGSNNDFALVRYLP